MGGGGGGGGAGGRAGGRQGNYRTPGGGKIGRFEDSEEDGRCSSLLNAAVRFLDLHFPLGGLDFLCFFTPFWDCFWTLFKSFVDYT